VTLGRQVGLKGNKGLVSQDTGPFLLAAGRGKKKRMLGR